MRIIGRTVIAAFVGAMTLVGAAASPTIASAAVAANATSAGPQIGGEFHFINGTGYVIKVNDLTANLGTQWTVFKTIYVRTAYGHPYYQYQDVSDGPGGDCLQANVADTAMVMGTCDTSSHRQFWWWNGNGTIGTLSNLLYGTDAYGGGDSNGAPIDLGSGSGIYYNWSVVGS